jgi:multidrug efflux pump subunit AcrB
MKNNVLFYLYRTSYSFLGEGEWKITLDVFRDMGIGFAFALVAILFLLKLQSSSSALALIIMSAIPLTIIGIMPGFWLLNLILYYLTPLQ